MSTPAHRPTAPQVIAAKGPGWRCRNPDVAQIDDDRRLELASIAAFVRLGRTAR
jgi:hypothetical protein